MTASVPTFTSDWFTGNALTGPGAWDLHVLSLLRRFEIVNWLEVGSHEGRSALWAAEHIVRGPGASVVCVDPWQHDPEAARLFDKNVLGRPTIVKMRGRSEDILPKLERSFFQGAYIDGSHEASDVRRDAELVFPLLVPGGVLVFDDYQLVTVWGKRSFPGVYEAATDFVHEHSEELRVVYAGWQLILQVRA